MDDQADLEKQAASDQVKADDGAVASEPIVAAEPAAEAVASVAPVEPPVTPLTTEPVARGGLILQTKLTADERTQIQAKAIAATEAGLKFRCEGVAAECQSLVGALFAAAADEPDADRASKLTALAAQIAEAVGLILSGTTGL
jgi:hypothetical protein